MAPNFSKNAILQGDVDFFCLVCEAYITSTTDCKAHICEPRHEKNFASITYVEEFKKDCIRKIKNKYFCEFCNKLLPLLARVRLHVIEPAHIEKKNVGWLKRIACVVIAFDEIVIDETAWHGLSDNSCAVCNTEYDNENAHKNLSSHIINLFQMKVDFDTNKNIYRKIDEFSFQCLTCNLVQTLSTMEDHFESTAHKQLFQICRECYKPLKEEVERSESIPNINQSYSKHKNNINNSIKIPKNIVSTSINQDKECNAVNKPKEFEMSKSTPQIEVLISTNSTNKNIETIHKVGPANNNECEENLKIPSTYKFDDKCEERICKVLKAKDYITYDENNRPWCILCDWIMDISKVRGHIAGKHHQSILKLHKNRETKLKQRNSNIDKDEENIVKTDNMKLLDSLDRFQTNDVNINLESKTVVCKKCSINLDYCYDAIENHILEHNKPQQQPNNKKEKSTLFDFAVSKGTERKDTLFSCPVLLKRDVNVEKTSEINDTKDSTKIEERIKENESKTIGVNQTFKQEVTDHDKQVFEEASPSKKIRKFKECTLEKIPSKDFIELLIAVKNGIFEDIIINNKICVNQLSFCLMTFHLDRFKIKCYACEETILYTALEAHTDTPKHEMAVRDAPVLIQLDTEFIREMRPGHYHCGFCNTCEPSWDDMETHLSSSDHKECKNDANWRLQRYQPDITRRQHENTIAEVVFANMLTRNFF